eukprot:4287131-Pyramimonas_sp.AAC.1
METAAKLHSTVHFSTMMRHTVSRLLDPRDWAEPAMGAHMRDLTCDFTQEYATAEWRAGVDAMPAGLTSYASNAKECRWRWGKATFPKGFQRQPPADM